MVVVVAYKERLIWPRALSSMDLFCFYRGRLLLERYMFFLLLVGQDNIIP